MKNKLQFKAWETVISVEVDGDLTNFATKLKAKIRDLDSIFSQENPESEIYGFKEGNIAKSKELKEALSIADYIKERTNGAFNHFHRNDNILDLYALSKGFCVEELVNMLKNNFSHVGVNAGGDIQVYSEVKEWKIGIEDPLNREQLIHAITLRKGGVCSSGNYLKEHIQGSKYDLSAVMGPSATIADGFATALLRDPAGGWLPKDYRAILHNKGSKVLYEIN